MKNSKHSPRKTKNTHPSSLLQEVLSRLKKSKYIGSGKYIAECPAHQDNEPSLSVTTGDDGRVLLKCFGGCSTEDVVSAIGIRMKDLFPSKRGGGGSIPAGKNPQQCNSQANHLKIKGKRTVAVKRSVAVLQRYLPLTRRSKGVASSSMLN